MLFGKEISGKGHRIDWLLQSEKPLKRKYETLLFNGRAFIGPNNECSTIYKRLKSLIKNIVNDFYLCKILKNNDYHLLLIKDKFIAGFVALILAKIYNIKFIYWLSFPFPEDSFFKVKERAVNFPTLYFIRGIVFHLLLYRIILKYCDHAFVQTEYMKEKIIKKGILKSKMTAVPMAVSIDDIPFFGYHSTDVSKDEKVIVYLGTLIKLRRIDFLIRVFNEVKKLKKNSKLKLVGDSEIPKDILDLKYEIKKHGLDDSVTITGFLPQKKAWEQIKDADVCVSPIYPSPSFDVGSPTKLLEYMAMGKASVANNHPEQQIVLRESQAGICVEWDESAFVKAIIYLIDNPEVASMMGKKGHEYIKSKRNYKETANTVEKILLRIKSEKIQC